MISQLDALDAAERAMTPGPFAFDCGLDIISAQVVGAPQDHHEIILSTVSIRADGSQVDSEGMVALRNTARLLIDLARKVEALTMEHPNRCHPLLDGRLGPCTCGLDAVRAALKPLVEDVQ